MSVQSQLKKFNETIKLDYDVKSELIEKREILLNKLRDSGKLPSFVEINQGSYAMNIGVEPLDKEFDIDVGLRFSVNKDDYEPMELKNIIYDVLNSHTYYGAKIKKPCVTITYKKNNEPAYHVDLVVYVYDDKSDKKSQMYMARGIPSNEDSQFWEKADPSGLVNFIKNAVENEVEKEQFRRIIRYLKRWKNLRFVNIGNAEPPSIGITLLVVDSFKYSDNDDLTSLLNVVKHIKSEFKHIELTPSNELVYRIKCNLPRSLNFETEMDIFKKMSGVQMKDFKAKIDKLEKDLIEVQEELCEQDQYKKLQKIFGEDFEIPDVDKYSKKQINYIPSSSASGGE